MKMLFVLHHGGTNIKKYSGAIVPLFVVVERPGAVPNASEILNVVKLCTSTILVVPGLLKII